ncbi:hypothetical protein F5X96DRAFT_670696 [Biscogniauxia mediterranea]|nr:hypothetical protein F5X96DRAFT_670696 [Biscogniauxia mediterranea]
MEPLTNKDFVDLLKTQYERFSDKYFPLHQSHLDAIRRCTDIVDADNVRRNVPKKRTRTILNDLWTHSPEVFVLAALAFTPTKIGTLKSRDYMGDILEWWEGKKIPGGLAEILDRHKDILPNASRDDFQISEPISLDELLLFLHQYFGRTPVDLILPYNGRVQAYVRHEDVKIEISPLVVNGFLEQRQSRNGV